MKPSDCSDYRSADGRHNQRSQKKAYVGAQRNKLLRILRKKRLGLDKNNKDMKGAT